ncbi:LysM domain-containing GPI-anchored protein LYP6 [Camellia lanceoleosa]|uniref:LysM domain-containing GPI-anchored protein LYP6 n=1 Tax=Camellia lanceoleosa TaxID=1840588 RepID=A0ACC0I3L7_9ERIC|nr:LysM domain-containing GPI-anchored protein LYP6 [Camellia lanceoleosa]
MPSLLSYRLPWDLKLSKVAFIFQLNISDILGSNNIDAMIRISNVEMPLTSGQRLVIPLPCMCLNNTDGEGGAVVYMSYVVEIGENLSSIGDEFGTTVHELEGVNGFDQSQVSPGDVLAIPIPG